MTYQGSKFYRCLARIRGVSDGTEMSLRLSKLAPLEPGPLPFVLMSPPLQPTGKWEAVERVGMAYYERNKSEGLFSTLCCAVLSTHLRSLPRRVYSRRVQTEELCSDSAPS